jgi:hypothetical protein
MKLRFAALALMVGSLAACGSSNTSTPTVPSFGPPAGQSTLTASMLTALLPAAVQNAGETQEQFCASILYVNDQFLTESFMAGFNGVGGNAKVDPSIIAPTIRAWCTVTT